MSLLRSVKTLIEKHYCMDKPIVSQLTPEMIRITMLAPELESEVEEGSIDERTGCNLQELVKTTQSRFSNE